MPRVRRLRTAAAVYCVCVLCWIALDCARQRQRAREVELGAREQQLLVLEASRRMREQPAATHNATARTRAHR